MAHSLHRTDVSPIVDLNTTPLIDVLLVLLVMFIITVPLQSHAVKLDLPTGPPVPHQLVDPVRNEIVINAAGQITWNGAAVSRPQLAQLLETTRELQPEPELHLKPEAKARYEIVDEVLAMTKRAEVSRMGFIGNESYAGF